MSTANVQLSTDFTAFHKFWCVCNTYHCFLRLFLCFMVYLKVFYFISKSFRDCPFRYYISLIYSVLVKEYTLCLLRFFFFFFIQMCSILFSVPYTTKICILLLLAVKFINFKYIQLIVTVFLMFPLSLLIFWKLILLMSGTWELKSSIKIANLPIFSSISYLLDLMHFEFLFCA